MKYKSSLKEYQNVKLQELEYATPYKAIQTLFARVLEKISIAKYSTQNNLVAEKGQSISEAITAIEVLQSSLNFEDSAEIANNLNNLYDYIKDLLISANLHDDLDQLSQAYNLVVTIKSGWDGIEDVVS